MIILISLLPYYHFFSGHLVVENERGKIYFPRRFNLKTWQTNRVDNRARTV